MRKILTILVCVGLLGCHKPKHGDPHGFTKPQCANGKCKLQLQGNDQ